MEITEGDRQGLVARAWGLFQRRWRAARDLVFVYIPAPAKVTSAGVVLTARESWALKGLPHLMVLKGRVVSAGPEVPADALREGDVVFFPRTHFAWLLKLDDGSYLGYIPLRHVAGVLPPDHLQE